MDAASAAAAETVSAPAKQGGRPREEEERPKELTVIGRQVGQSAAASLAKLSAACNVGSKKSSKGFEETLTGYR